MKNRAGKTVQNLSGEMAYTSFYPQPLPPQPNIEIDAEMQRLLIDAHKKLALLNGLSDRIPNKDLFISMQGTVVGDRNNNGLFSCDTPLLFSPTAEENVSLILLLKDSFWG